jgi:hypothetical protein
MAYGTRAEVAAQVGYVVQIRPVGNPIPPDGRVVDEQDRSRRALGNFRAADHVTGEALLHVIGERRRGYGCQRRFDAGPDLV